MRLSYSQSAFGVSLSYYCLEVRHGEGRQQVEGVAREAIIDGPVFAGAMQNIHRLFALSIYIIQTLAIILIHCDRKYSRIRCLRSKSMNPWFDWR